MAVTITEDVVSDPTQNPPIPQGEHGSKDGLEKRLAGLAVFAAGNRLSLLGEFLNGREGSAEGRGEVDVRQAEVERGPSIE